MIYQYAILKFAVHHAQNIILTVSRASIFSGRKLDPPFWKNKKETVGQYTAIAIAPRSSQFITLKVHTLTETEF